VTKREHGGDRKSEETKFNNVQLDPSPMGNSRAAALGRLRKDRPDLHATVIGSDARRAGRLVLATGQDVGDVGMVTLQGADSVSILSASFRPF
jgi:hypothetical protein